MNVTGLRRDGLLLAGVAMLAAGMAYSPFGWAELSTRLPDAIAIFALMGVPTLLLGRWKGAGAAVACLGIGFAACALQFAGVAALAAALLLLAGSAALGTLLPSWREDDALPRWVAGLGIVAAIGGWLVPFPVHRALPWAVFLAAVVALRRKAVMADFGSILSLVRQGAGDSRWAFAAWAGVLFVAAAPAWLPRQSPDDLAYHLTLGAEFLAYGHGLLAIGSQSWALAPWASDMLYAITSVLAGSQHAGPLAGAWLAMAGLLVYLLARRTGMEAGRSWLASMLYLSIPLTSVLVGMLQTETATAAVIAALALAIPGEPGTRALRLPTIAVLAGFALAMKASNALLLAPFLVWLVVSWRDAFPFRALPRAMSYGALVAGSSYLYAFALTGNPVMPMLNAYFGSPWFPAENFVDATWQTGVDWRSWWDLTFDTSRFLESADGAIGVVLVALAGGLVVGVADRRTRAVLLVALAAMALVFYQVQYVRYVHPALAILVPALAVSLLPPTGRWTWREFVLAAVVAVQLALVPTASWIISKGALRTLVTEGRQAVSDQVVPERGILARFRDSAVRTDRVLIVDPARSHSAELPGMAVGTAWFTPLTWSVRNAGPPDAGTWAKVVDRAGSNYVLVHALPSWPGVAAFLLERGAVRIEVNGVAELFWLPPVTIEDPAVRRVEGGGVEVAMDVQRPHPVVGQAVATLECDRPGEPIAVSWVLLSGNEPPVSHSDWVQCGPDSRSVAVVQFEGDRQAAQLVFGARPAFDATKGSVDLGEIALDVRRDFRADTELRTYLARSFCEKAGCEVASRGVSPVTRGPLARWALAHANQEGESEPEPEPGDP